MFSIYAPFTLCIFNNRNNRCESISYSIWSLKKKQKSQQAQKNKITALIPFIESL